MKSASILPLAIMLAATSMFGQSLTQPPRIDPSKCPVGLEVEQNGSLVAYKNAKCRVQQTVFIGVRSALISK